MATKTINRERVRKLLRQGKRSDEIAPLVPCGIRSVQRIAKELGVELPGSGSRRKRHAPVERSEARLPVKSYLGWVRAGCPVDVRQNEGLSAVGGQLGCEVYTRVNSVGRGAAE
jgi:hypothetical protein